MVIGLSHYLAVAAILFTIGVFGIFVNRKNVIIILFNINTQVEILLYHNYLNVNKTIKLI